MIWLRSKIIKTFFNTPDIFPTGFLESSRNYQLNKFRKNFWTFIVRKQKYYQDFYQNNLNYKSINLDTITCTKYKAPLIIKRYGIAIIKNILDDKELDLFILKSNENLKNGKKRYLGDSVLELTKRLENIDDIASQKLVNLSNYLFKKCLGQDRKNKVQINVQKLIKSEKSLDSNDSDSIFHCDRFIPTIKIFYYPLNIKKGFSQFEFIPYSHRIDSNYLNNFDNYYKDVANKKISENPCVIKNHVQSDSLKLNVPANSVVICATNGLHRRSPFSNHLVNVQAERLSAHILIYNQQTKINLIKNFINSFLYS